MIMSMTGYGSAEGRVRSVTYAVEIKTVNNRYFKSAIRLPEPMTFLEDDIDKLLRRELSRGMVNLTLRLKDVGVDVFFELDEKTMATLLKRLNKVASNNVNTLIDIGSLLTLPGILSPVIPDEKTVNLIRRKVIAITQKAIKGVQAMRIEEGKALAADLNKHCDAIRGKLKRISGRSDASPVKYGRKLKKRVDDLLANAKVKLDDETIAREVAIFADRTDISEEIARLDSHLRQFTKTIEGNEQAGRKLDFICQEMLREANTIASKSQDPEVVHWVVDIKCLIDKIKEQVQNVE